MKLIFLIRRIFYLLPSQVCFELNYLRIRVKMPFMSKKLTKVLIGIGIVLFFFVSRKPVIKVETFKVGKGEIIESISSSGRIDAQEKADLTFQGSGRLSWVGVKEGAAVKKYQAIAKLDTVLLNAAYQEAMNSYRSYEAAAQKAEDDVKGHSADETFTQKSTRMAAQVARDNAYDAVKAAEQSLKFATITAPFNGLITKAEPAFPGSNVTSATAVYSLVNPETFYFSTEVGETDITKVKVGQKVILSLDAFSEKPFESFVENIGIASVITSTGGTAYKVKISLPKTEGVNFRLGMNGDAEIIIKTITDVLSVPSDSVVEDNNGSFVWVVKAGKAKKVKVEVGGSSVESTEIKSGLSEGDLVIVGPPAAIKNGSKVKI